MATNYYYSGHKLWFDLNAYDGNNPWYIAKQYKMDPGWESGLQSYLGIAYYPYQRYQMKLNPELLYTDCAGRSDMSNY